jgi:hypothetical protein
MFQETWDYLAEHAAPRGTEGIRVRFGSTADISNIDLEQFRLYGNELEVLLARVGLTTWNLDALYGLFDVARSLDASRLEQRRNWPRYSPYSDVQYELPEIEVPSGAFGAMIGDVHRAFQMIIDKASQLTRTTSRNLYEAGEADGMDSEIQSSATLLTDLFPSWFSIFDCAADFTPEQSQEALIVFQEKVEPHLSRSVEVRETLMRRALDLLALPFWKRRWQTYEVWAAIQCLKALSHLQPRPRIENGWIALDGSLYSTIAYLDGAELPNVCVRIQVETPFLVGRRKAIRPDLSVSYDEKPEAESHAAIVEFKQRLSLGVSHVEEVARAYCDGAPRSAGVIIINYDETAIKPSLPKKATLIEGVRPGKPEAIDKMHKELQRLVHAAGIFSKWGNAVVLLDVSGSMGSLYDNEAVRAHLKRLLELTWLKILRFNTGIVEGGDLPAEAKVATGGGTDLKRAFTEAVEILGEIDTLLVVTDGNYGAGIQRCDRPAKYRECRPDELAEAIKWVGG